VERLERVQPILGHHPPGLAIVIAAPGEDFHIEGKALAFGQGHEDFEAGGDDLLADTIPGDGSNVVAAHGLFL
jgi:hypothetical protein